MITYGVTLVVILLGLMLVALALPPLMWLVVWLLSLVLGGACYEVFFGFNKASRKAGSVASILIGLLLALAFGLGPFCLPVAVVSVLMVAFGRKFAEALQAETTEGKTLTLQDCLARLVNDCGLDPTRESAAGQSITSQLQRLMGLVAEPGLDGKEAAQIALAMETITVVNPESWMADEAGQVLRQLQPITNAIATAADATTT